VKGRNNSSSSVVVVVVVVIIVIRWIQKMSGRDHCRYAVMGSLQFRVVVQEALSDGSDGLEFILIS